jgi:hypothetical protein
MYCSKCKIQVVIINGVVITPCKCNAPVIADIGVKLKGVANVNGVKTDNRR